jgi:hypothetical protein
LPPQTTMAPKGPPRPEVTFSVASAMACRISWGSPSIECLRTSSLGPEP